MQLIKEVSMVMLILHELKFFGLDCQVKYELTHGFISYLTILTKMHGYNFYEWLVLMSLCCNVKM